MQTEVIIGIITALSAAAAGLIGGLSKFAKLFISSSDRITESYNRNAAEDRAVYRQELSRIHEYMSNIKDIHISTHSKIENLDSKVTELGHKQESTAHVIMGILENNYRPGQNNQPKREVTL